MFRQPLKQSISESNKIVKSKNCSISDITATADLYDQHYTNLYERYYQIFKKNGNKDWYNRSCRVEDCGSYYEFALFQVGGLKLRKANFCGDRLCLMCNWRRSLKTYPKIARIIDYLTSQSEKKYRFLFLTLTIRNCEPSELHQTINDIFYSFDKFKKNKRIKKILRGYFRTLEITYNPDTQTFHPHLHIIFAVDFNYFTHSDKYIKQADYTKIWQSSANLDYEPIIDIRAFKNSDDKGVKEASKYIIKLDNELLKKISDKNLEVLRTAISYRRLMGLGGILRQIAAELKIKIDDDEDINRDYDESDVKDDTLLAILRFFHTRDRAKGYKGFIYMERETVGF